MSRIVRIDGEIVAPAEVDIVETEPGVYSVLRDGVSYEVRITEAEIAAGSHRMAFEIEDPRQWKRTGQAAGSQGRSLLKSAMPGKIVRVLVAVGDEVAAGQGIMVIEAMKMQNELKSPRAGRVTSIEVKANDSVNAGAALASIE
jgi:biotin carboxyl carrier protein